MKILQKKIIIVGVGPAGVGAALTLSRQGFRDIVILDRFDRVGGIPGKYTRHGKPTFILWSKAQIRHGSEYADSLSEQLNRTGIDIRLGTTVIRFHPEEREIEAVSKQDGFFRIRADAILFACGARESTAVERGWMFGQRPARVFHTFHLLQLLNEIPEMPQARVAIVGSEVVAYSTAAKLAQTLNRPLMIDHGKTPDCSVLSRFYFFRGQTPQRIQNVQKAYTRGDMSVEGIRLEKKPAVSIPADYLYLCGNFVPNTELLATADIPFHTKTRQLTTDSEIQLRQQGIFIAGNMIGKASGGEKAYFRGVFSGRRIAAYLK